MVKKYAASNLVYGQMYADFFVNNHLKSLLDPTNIASIKADGVDMYYLLFTDDETFNSMQRHPQFIAFSRAVKLDVVKVNWPPDVERFGLRYTILTEMFHKTLVKALELGTDYMSVWVADLVFAKHCLPRLVSRMDEGHDAVFNVPIRGAADAINPHLNKMDGAPTDMQLFELAYQSLHHLWTHSHWNNPLFTRMPYSMLWNSGTGLVAHNFGIPRS